MVWITATTTIIKVIYIYNIYIIYIYIHIYIYIIYIYIYYIYNGFSLPEAEILIRLIGPSCFPSAHLCDGIAIPTKLLYSSNPCPQLEHSLTFTLLSILDTKNNGRFQKFNFSKEKLPWHTLFINYFRVYLTYCSTFHFEAYRKLNQKLSGLYLQTNNNVFCISNRNSNDKW